MAGGGQYGKGLYGKGLFRSIPHGRVQDVTGFGHHPVAAVFFAR